jgi:hypothetical protein
MTASTHDAQDACVVVIPEQHLDQVLNYVAGLEREEAEVAGFAGSMTSGASGGGKISGTGCKVTAAAGDFTCTDSDNITSK